jgi:uncharacterized protein
MELFPIFLTGLFVGGLTCLAVQGGLLAATIAQREEARLKENSTKTGDAIPILSFLIAKLAAYTLLGFLLGWFGSLFQLSITAQVILQIAVVIFMLGTAFNILEVHPIFRYFVIQPPRFLTNLIRSQTKSQNIFAPATLGAFTVFIPCGTTQAMMALAIASGSPLLGALIMFVFTLGTSPLFFTLGLLAIKLGDGLRFKFMRVAAYAIILLALFNFNNTLALSGSTFTFDKIFKSFICTISFCSGSQVLATGEASNDVTINIVGGGYNPNNFSVNGGQNVTLRLKNTEGYGCSQAFTIPSLGIQRIIPVGSSDTIQFKAPNGPTQIAFMCSMGMYRGFINVL